VPLLLRGLRPRSRRGEYLAGIEVVDEVHKDRVVSRVYAKAPDSMFVEANTGNLARSLDAAGGA